jgi:tetratricopeptide (TPR) repeat protein
MPKEKHNQPKKRTPVNGKGVNGASRTNGARRSRRSAASSEAALRFRLASLLRLSDNWVTKAVGAYDRLFELGTTDQAEIYLEMGKEFARGGKLEEALEALRKAGDLRPEDGEPVFEVGLVHLHKQAPEAAVSAFTRARALGVTGYRLHKALAEALIQLERLEEALTELQSARDLDPEDPDVSYQLGMTFDHLGRYDEAVAAYERAIEIAPDAVAYQQSLGLTLDSAGRRKDAIKCFKRALELEHRQAAEASYRRT